MRFLLVGCLLVISSISINPQRLNAQRPETQRPETQRPNVVVMLCDDIRWNALSCAGHPHLKTPNIDRLAEEGIFFENMFCTTSLCSPSRATILSGVYAHTHGVTNNFTDYPTQLDSFPRRLQQAGYQTAYIGKWHMGEKSDEPRPGIQSLSSRTRVKESILTLNSISTESSAKSSRAITRRSSLTCRSNG